MTQRYLFPAVASIVFSLGLFFGYLWAQQSLLARVDQPTQLEASPRAVVFQLIIDPGDGTVKTLNDISFTEGETLLASMQKILAKEKIELRVQEYKGLGSLVTKIGAQENGKDGRYWQYWVNARYAPVGADQYPLHPGDIVEWKFSAFQGS